jgi:chromosome segregation ATPase
VNAFDILSAVRSQGASNAALFVRLTAASFEDDPLGLWARLYEGRLWSFSPGGAALLEVDGVQDAARALVQRELAILSAKQTFEESSRTWLREVQSAEFGAEGSTDSPRAATQGWSRVCRRAEAAEEQRRQAYEELEDAGRALTRALSCRSATDLDRTRRESMKAQLLARSSAISRAIQATHSHIHEADGALAAVEGQLAVSEAARQKAQHEVMGLHREEEMRVADALSAAADAARRREHLRGEWEQKLLTARDAAAARRHDLITSHSDAMALLRERRELAAEELSTVRHSITARESSLRALSHAIETSAAKAAFLKEETNKFRDSIRQLSDLRSALEADVTNLCANWKSASDARASREAANAHTRVAERLTAASAAAVDGCDVADACSTRLAVTFEELFSSMEAVTRFDILSNHARVRGGAVAHLYKLRQQTATERHSCALCDAVASESEAHHRHLAHVSAEQEVLSAEVSAVQREAEVADEEHKRRVAVLRSRMSAITDRLHSATQATVHRRAKLASEILSSASTRDLLAKNFALQVNDETSFAVTRLGVRPRDVSTSAGLLAADYVGWCQDTDVLARLEAEHANAVEDLRRADCAAEDALSGIGDLRQSLQRLEAHAAGLEMRLEGQRDAPATAVSFMLETARAGLVRQMDGEYTSGVARLRDTTEALGSMEKLVVHLDGLAEKARNELYDIRSRDSP